MRLVWTVLVAAIIAAGLAGGGVYYFVSQHTNKDKADLQSKIDDLTTQVVKYKAAIASSSDTATKPTVDTGAAVSTTDSGKGVATTALSNYLTAKKTRGLENAKPYMTDAFYQSYTQETFAGVSSPSMGRFEILSVTAKVVNTFYSASTKLWYSLGGQEVGYYPNTYEIIKSGTSYLVNSETQGKWTDSGN